MEKVGVFGKYVRFLAAKETEEARKLAKVPGNLREEKEREEKEREEKEREEKEREEKERVENERVENEREEKSRTDLENSDEMERRRIRK